MPPACCGKGVAHLLPDPLMHVHIFFEGFWADVKEEAGAAGSLALVVFRRVVRGLVGD